VFAPVCLTWGLQRSDALSASLLLNFEAVFTVLLAWVVPARSDWAARGPGACRDGSRRHAARGGASRRERRPLASGWVRSNRP